MLAASKTSKKRIILYVIIIVTMVAGNIFIYYSNTSKPEADLSADNFMAELNGPLPGPASRETQANQSVLGHNVFTSLKKVGDWPLNPVNIGKADPFAPFLGN